MKTADHKETAQKAWGLTKGKDLPLVLVSSPDQALLSIIEEILDAMMAVGLQLALVDTDTQLSGRLEALRERYPESVALVSADETRKDCFDMEVLHEPQESDVKRFKTNPRVPVAERGIQAFDPLDEQGCGFLFDASNPWSLLVALLRGAETYRFPYDWKNLLRSVKRMTSPAD